MKIYHLIGWDAPYDWTTSKRKYTLGYYLYKGSAQERIGEIKRQPHWRHDWSSFEIEEITVIGE